jgi:hypothetical protein
VDSRTFKSPEEFDNKLGGAFHEKPWLSQGRNHRVTPSGIEREFDAEDWFIEIDDLMEFVKKHGHVVLGFRDRDPHVEIYDDYRE